MPCLQSKHSELQPRRRAAFQSITLTHSLKSLHPGLTHYGLLLYGPAHWPPIRIYGKRQEQDNLQNKITGGASEISKGALVDVMAQYLFCPLLWLSLFHSLQFHEWILHSYWNFCIGLTNIDFS